MSTSSTYTSTPAVWSPCPSRGLAPSRRNAVFRAPDGTPKTPMATRPALGGVNILNPLKHAVHQSVKRVSTTVFPLALSASALALGENPCTQNPTLITQDLPSSPPHCPISSLLCALCVLCGPIRGCLFLNPKSQTTPAFILRRISSPTSPCRRASARV